MGYRPQRSRPFLVLTKFPAKVRAFSATFGRRPDCLTQLFHASEITPYGELLRNMTIRSRQGPSRGGSAPSPPSSPALSLGSTARRWRMPHGSWGQALGGRRVGGRRSKTAMAEGECGGVSCPSAASRRVHASCPPVPSTSVIPGLEPGIHGPASADAAWILGSSPRRTEGGVTSAAEQQWPDANAVTLPVRPLHLAVSAPPARPSPQPPSFQALSLESTPLLLWCRGSSAHPPGRRSARRWVEFVDACLPQAGVASVRDTPYPADLPALLRDHPCSILTRSIRPRR
ncbi:hypothetical protein Rleg9DRAFT_2672 [Rhizobium leguminosarum bv. trifolii WSM597]|uniref:Uncharacterized protein n=1 Tax=Rhizobium leguminosarum bv. trifolii WSM597 TaxID=754764 RepID=J0H1J0_RHILT|nr:hypothetical protein Rleg9DRAFT_2672 [Rhizobium leguminosarum bv. trifolii WSM597]